MAAALPFISVAASLISAVGSMKKDKAPAAAAPLEVPAPVAEAPARAPSVDDAQVALARKRSIASQVSRRGRASTILTGDSDSSLGGGLLS